MIKEYDYLFKVVVVGNSSVGKSALIKRLADDSFIETYLATIGVDFRFKSLTVEGHVVKLQIWDTAGQYRFRTITGAYYKGAHAIVLVYDITKKATFNDAVTFWLGEIYKYATGDVRVFLVGNKSDCEYQRTISPEEVSYVVIKNKLPHFLASAKTGENVSSIFTSLSEVLISIFPPEQTGDEPNKIVEDIKKRKKDFHIKSGTTPYSKSKGCC